MKKTITIFVLMMVVCLPLSMAFTMSGTGYGQDELPGFIRQTDSVTLQVDFQQYNPEDGNLVYETPIGVDPRFTCSQNTCLLDLPTDTYESRPQEFKTVFNYDGGTQEEIITLYPDNIGASVNSVVADNYFLTSNDAVTFTIEVEDKSCSTLECSNRCSGLRKLNIHQGSYPNKVHEVPLFSDLCSGTITETVPVADLNPDEGRNNFIFELEDTIGNEAEDIKSIILNVDSTPPGLESTEFFIRDGEDNLEFYKDALFNKELVFYLTEDAESVRIINSNFGLNPSGLNCRGMTCTKNINLDLGNVVDGESVTLSIDVELVDQKDNSQVYTLTKTLEVDREGPSIDDVYSKASINDAIVLGPRTNLTIEVSDDGIGADKVIVDFSSVNPSRTNVAANCNNGICVFPSIPIVNEGRLQLTANAVDLLGNVAEDYVFYVESDKTIANVVSIEVYFEDTDFEFDNVSLPSVGDELTVVAVLEDSSSVFAYGDFSAINEEGIFEADCEGGEDVDNWPDSDYPRSGRVDREPVPGQIVCQWDVDVDVSGSIINGEVELFFEDPQGNLYSENVIIPNIYGIDEADNPNFWSTTVQCSPSRIDRKVGEIMEQQQFCYITLNPLTDFDQQITSLELRNCKGDYLDDEEIGNEHTSYPYLILYWDQDDYSEENEIEASCEIEINSIVGSQIIENEEEEIVNITTPLFNNPFGLPDDAIVGKIKDVEDRWLEGFGNFIRVFSLIVKASKTLCKSLKTLNTVVAVVDTAASTVPDLPAGSTLRELLEIPSKANNAAKKSGNKFCKFVNCQSDMLFGGGGGNLYDFITDKTGGQVLSRFGADPETYTGKDRSIISSTLSFCIPGILTNLQKYRQIQCFYGYCMLEMTAFGIPPYECEKQKGYSTCMYFVGPVFRVIPWVRWADQWIGLVKDAITDPFALIGVLANVFCSPAQATWSTCRVVDIVTIMVDTWNDVESIWGEFRMFKEDYCTMFEDALDDADRGAIGSGGGRGYV